MNTDFASANALGSMYTFYLIIKSLAKSLVFPVATAGHSDFCRIVDQRRGII